MELATLITKREELFGERGFFVSKIKDIELKIQDVEGKIKALDTVIEMFKPPASEQFELGDVSTQEEESPRQTNGRTIPDMVLAVLGKTAEFLTVREIVNGIIATGYAPESNTFPISVSTACGRLEDKQKIISGDKDGKRAFQLVR